MEISSSLFPLKIMSSTYNKTIKTTPDSDLINKLESASEPLNP